MKQCAPTVSKHFTNLTAVINDGNSYEFPSNDLHRSIINKLITNDKTHFKHLFAHIRKSYKADEKLIRDQYAEFAQQVDVFMAQIDNDNSQRVTSINIDNYMKDLRKHAYNEYEELHQKEQQLNQSPGSKSRRKKKKKRDSFDEDEVQPQKLASNFSDTN